MLTNSKKDEKMKILIIEQTVLHKENVRPSSKPYEVSKALGALLISGKKAVVFSEENIKKYNLSEEKPKPKAPAKNEPKV